VRPTRPRPKADRRDRRKKAAADDTGTDTGSDTVTGAVAVATDDTVATAAASASSTRASGSRAKRRPSTRSTSSTVSSETGPDAGPTSEDRTMTDDTGSDSTSPAPRRDDRPAADPAEVGAAAVSFLEGLVEAFGLEGTVSLHDVDGEMEVRVDGGELGLLVGPRGTTLLAVQDITRVASQRRLGDHDTRLRVDVAGYREKRREALGRFAQKIAAEVAASGEEHALEPMPSADRKVIHDTLADHEAVVTRSEGDDPHRHVVIAPRG
jgi:spoIIIJ-associated protein